MATGMKDNSQRAMDEAWMQEALILADAAAARGEVPVGALVVLAGRVIGRGFNQPISQCDPTAHAEILALRHAANTMGNYRLPGAVLYVTLEPCSMCAGAIVHSRLQRVVFGALEPKAGALVSAAALLDAPHMNHRVAYEGGICADACGQRLTQFFAQRRERKRLL